MKAQLVRVLMTQHLLTNPRMSKRTAFDLAVLLVAGVVIALNLQVVTDVARELLKRHHRGVLFAELKPALLANCALARFGNANDGGYLMCGNLLGNVRGAYSYGIGGRDEWGCAMAQALAVPVHQYRLFRHPPAELCWGHVPVP